MTEILACFTPNSIDAFVHRLLTEMTGIRARVAKNPVQCVAIGTGRSLEHVDVLSEGAVNLARARQQRQQ